MESNFNFSAEVVWSHVERSSTLIKVAWPLARIEPVGRKFPEKWQQDTSIICRYYLFGIIPVGIRRIFFEKINSSSMQLQSRESDPLINRWDHLISVRSIDGDSCIYSDEIEIDAGRMTFAIWLWAQWFYHHRQKRWRKLLNGEI